MAGWNGSGMGGNSTPIKPKAAAKKPSPIRGIVAGAVLVAAVIGCYFAFFSGSEKPQKEVVEKERGKIKEVMPAPAPILREEPKKEEVPRKVNPLREKNSKMTPEQKDALVEKKLAETPIAEESTNRTYRTGLEQVIDWVFTTEPGDVPPPMPMISDFDLVHFQEIIELKNKANETDSEVTAEAKAIVDHVKAELKKYVDKGGDPQEFLEFYHSELQQAFSERQVAREQVLKVVKTEPDIALDYLEKVNASLAEKGIKGVELGPRIMHRYGLTGKENNNE